MLQPGKAEITAGGIIRLLMRARLPLANEKRLQAALAEQFARAGIAFEREVAIAGGIIDFRMQDGTGIECKIGGRQKAIFDQIEAYSADTSITNLILATNKAMALPETIGGKPCCVVNLGRAWL